MLNFMHQKIWKNYAPRTDTNTLLKMNVYIDVASVELFADEGATVMTDIFFPNEDFNQAAIFSKNGTTQIVKGEI